MADGWIKLYRKTIDNPIVMKDAEYLAVWIWLLMNATHKPMDAYHDGKRITLEPGQLITGRKKIASDLRISESKTERVLTCFESEHQIEQQKCSKNRLVSILHWDLYQESEQPNEQQLNNKWTTSEQQVNTNKKQRNKELRNINNIYIKTTASSFINLILNTGDEYPIYQEDVDNYKALYPAVDVEQELRKMRGWCEANPSKRKTKNGIKRFINSWLAKEQDKCHSQKTTRSHNFAERTDNLDADIMKKFEELV